MDTTFTPPEERRLAPYSALNDAGVNAPGPRLADMADTVLLAVAERFDDEPDATESQAFDWTHDIADGAVPMMTATILETASEDLGVLQTEPEIGPAFDGSPTIVNIAAAVLYELAEQIAGREIQRRIEARDES